MFRYRHRPHLPERVTYGLANPSRTNATDPIDELILHTLGYNNDSAENWDYFVFNDRDFSSVAELLLVPGCPPGLFTKQFVEFAPSQMNAANIFSAVTPVITPTYPTISAVTTTVGFGHCLSRLDRLATFATATVPFLDVSQATTIEQPGRLAPQPGTDGFRPSVPRFHHGLCAHRRPVRSRTGTIPTPVQPHAFPYLVDKFFYTGASTFYYPPNRVPGIPAPSRPTGPPAHVPVVGGPGGDGWFKMFEFFEVPSQMNGAIGPVAQGANFDWARQDIKPGLMNLNLIIDEEAFFAIFGRQSTSGFNQTLLNSIELPLLANTNANGQLVLPYTMPLATARTTAYPPIPQWGPPVPLVVSAIQPNGAPNYVYPVTDQTQYIQHGYLTDDPIWTAINSAAKQVVPQRPLTRSATGSRRPSRSSSGCATAGRATCSATARQHRGE